jgi:hypothetical protein
MRANNREDHHWQQRHYGGAVDLCVPCVIGCRRGQGPVPVVYSLFVGQPAGRLPGRRHAVAVRPGRAGICLYEVPGELGQGDITAAGPLGLELHAEPLVQPGPISSVTGSTSASIMTAPAPRSPAWLTIPSRYPSFSRPMCASPCVLGSTLASSQGVG